MSMTKTQAESQDKPASAPVAVKQPETPEKAAGPQRVAQTAEGSATPPPTGAPSSVRGAEMLADGPRGAGAVRRAQTMMTLQRRVGNSRISSLIGTRIQTKISVGAPGDAYEREADSVAEKVTQQPRPDSSTSNVQRQPLSVNISRIYRMPAGASTLPVNQPDPKADKHQESAVQLASPQVTRIARDIQAKEEDRESESDNHKIVEPEAKLQLSATGHADNQEDAAANMESRITSPSAGQPLPEGVQGEMEGALGADFSGVRVHNSATDTADAAHLGAKAFTHGNDIWLGAGESAHDRKLMAHELTHVVQQNGQNLQGTRTQKNAVDPLSANAGPQAGSAHNEKQSDQPISRLAGSKTPDIQASWYNFSIPFTDYEFDPSISGIKTAAGLAKDTVVDTASWAKDKVAEAFQWVFDKIKGLIDDGINWLKSEFAKIEDFANSAFDTITNGLSALLDNITSPADLLTNAFKLMDADLLGSAWKLLKSGASMVLNGIKTVIDGVLGTAKEFWDTVSGFVSGLFDTIEGIIDSWPFRQLPGALQRAAKGLFDEIRAVWDKIRDFLTDLLARLKAYADNILESIASFAKNVVEYGIETVINTVKAIGEAWEFVKEVAADPIGYIQPHVDKLAAQLNAEAPPKAIALGEEKLKENSKGAVPTVGGDSVIQRQPADTKPKRSTASPGEVWDGFVTAIKAAWAGLDIGKMLMDTIVNMFWPPATIKAIGHEFSELWNTDWANAAASLFAPRAPWDDFFGFFHDVWSNILVLLDFPLALWRRLNSVLMLLMGYLTIILVIVFAILGGVAGAALGGGVGAIPGALAGAVFGLEIAAAIGEFLLASYLVAEGLTVVKALLELLTARQTQTQKDSDYVQIAGSLIGMAIAVLIMVILWFLNSLVSAVVGRIKGTKVAVGEATKPATESPGVKPGETAKAAEPAKPVEPAKPTEPAKPADEVKPPAPDIEPVSAVKGKPNTYKVNTASALKATTPVRKGLFLHWELYVELPNGARAVFCEVNVRFGSPDLNLYPKAARVKGMAEPVTLQLEGLSWTTESLRLTIENYKAKFGSEPKNLGGYLAKKNLANFQYEFASIRAKNPGLSNEQIGEMAIKNISFGQARIPLGYENFRITILRVGKVKLLGKGATDLAIEGTTQTVPTTVRIESTKSPILPVPKIPPVVPNVGEEEGEGE